MAINFKTLQDTVNRRGKIADATAKVGVASDLNIAQQIVASLRFWPELAKVASLTITKGIDTYPLEVDVDDIEQIILTTPSGYSKEIPFINKTELRRFAPVASLNGEASPIVAYFSEPTVNTDGSEVKNITFWTIPDQTYVVNYSYKKVVVDMADQSDYPFFNNKFHHILIDYALWKEAETNPDESKNPNYWKEEWQGPLYPQVIGGGLAQILSATLTGNLKFPISIPGPDRA